MNNRQWHEDQALGERLQRTNEGLLERVGAMREWARSRIVECQRQEEKFGASWQHREKHQHGPPQSLVEAWTERRALQAVLDQLRRVSPT